MWRNDYFENILRAGGYRAVAGIDEVGRGALAGPVVAAAVILGGTENCGEFLDSKVLTPRKRERLAARIYEEAAAVGFGSVSESEIDASNILRATHKAMLQAVTSLSIHPDMVLVDGFWLQGLDAECMGIIDGDALSYTISAASIVAKVHRDAFMTTLSERYPEYGFEKHKGYGSEFHRRAIARVGPCPAHRRSFGGVREFVSGGGGHGR